jgi:hypothetical protein
MQRLKILYLGVESGTSLHRARALERLGHSVTIVDPAQFLPGHRAVRYWVHHAGAGFFGTHIRRKVLAAIGQARFDLAFVDGGGLVDRELAAELKRRCGSTVNLNVDDPFGSRDGNKWQLYLECVPLYDLLVVVRDCNVDEAFACGARDVLKIYRSADEVAHAPRGLTANDAECWRSDVAFIGTWMPERGPFLARLVDLGIPLTIYGDRWHKAPEWSVLKPNWKGPGLYNDDDYAKAAQCAGVCLGLLSRGNRDLSTQRSFEIPYLGGLLCAERTTEHTRLYQEGEEALFWSTPEECAAQCRRALADEQFRRRVAAGGRARCLKNQTTNEAVLRSILDTALDRTGGFARLAS